MLGVDIYNEYHATNHRSHDLPPLCRNLNAVSYNNSDGTRSTEDPQCDFDHRYIEINRVGIKGLKYPALIRDGLNEHFTTMTCDVAVSLRPEIRGTHMSRMIQLVEDIAQDLTFDNLNNVAHILCDVLDARCSFINISFPYFIKKKAPITKIEGMMNYDVQYNISCYEGSTENRITVAVPVSSVCPCSKAISIHGAHNQRSRIVVSIQTAVPYPIEQLILNIERQGSCELYSLLKRPDEKFVTEKGYENPKFVEDIVRDVAALLEQDSDIDSYSIEVENYESIHNHSAYAVIEK